MTTIIADADAGADVLTLFYECTEGDDEKNANNINEIFNI